MRISRLADWWYSRETKREIAQHRFWGRSPPISVRLPLKPFKNSYFDTHLNVSSVTLWQTSEFGDSCPPTIFRWFQILQNITANHLIAQNSRVCAQKRGTRRPVGASLAQWQNKQWVWVGLDVAQPATPKPELHHPHPESTPSGFPPRN